MPAVRIARPEDRERVLQTVVGAFSADPAWAFICGEDYARVAPHFAGTLFDARVHAGTVWMTADGSAVAMWDGPDADPHGAELWADFREQAGEPAAERLARYDGALAPLRPRGPFWYLGVLAADPRRRRQGLATAVLQPGIGLADRAGLRACLETSTAENKHFYANRGFTDAAEVDVAGGPATWWLTRHPA